MKKFFKFFALTATAASVFASCAKQSVSTDVEEPSVPMVQKTFTVIYSDEPVDDSKVTIGEGNALLWAEGDQLTVWPKTGDDATDIQGKVTLVAGAGTATGTFSGEVPESENGYFFLYNGNTTTKVRYSDLSINPNIKVNQKACPGQCDQDCLILLGVSESADAAVTLKTVNGYFKVGIGESTTHKIASVDVCTILTTGKAGTVGGVTISEAQRIYYNEDYTIKKYANSGRNNLTLEPADGYDHLTPGVYWLSAAVTGLSIDNLYIILTDMTGNFALLKGGACKVEPGKAIFFDATSLDSFTWHTGSMVANAAISSAILNDDGIAVTGKVESYPDVSFVNNKTWTIQYKAEDSDSWSNSSLTGTGAIVSGTVTGLPAGKTYYLRIACENIYSDPSEGILIPAVGNRTITFDVSDGNFFKKFTKKESSPEMPATYKIDEMSGDTKTYIYDDVEWNFYGQWGYFSKKLCTGANASLGLPVISGMRLSKVMADNAHTADRGYSIVDADGNVIEGGETKTAPAGGSASFTLKNNDDSECRLTIPSTSRIQKMTLEYEIYSGTKSDL